MSEGAGLQLADVVHAQVSGGRKKNLGSVTLWFAQNKSLCQALSPLSVKRESTSVEKPLQTGKH